MIFFVLLSKFAFTAKTFSAKVFLKSQLKTQEPKKLFHLKSLLVLKSMLLRSRANHLKNINSDYVLKMGVI